MADLTADYIVVGGGLTGCTMASPLSQGDKKPKVVLIKAGPYFPGNQTASTFLGGLSLLGGELDYLYKTEPDPNTNNRVHCLNAGKVLGGLVQYERWSSKSLVPWFTKVEAFHDPNARGTTIDKDGGRMRVFPVSACESANRKYLLRGPVKEAWTELGGLTEFYENPDPQGMRQPSFQAYPLDDVQVLTNTVVHHVLFDTGSRRARANGIELADGRRVMARNEVILCAGAYRTPQVLMLSGIGPSDTLAKHGIPQVHDSPQVGQNLHDHFAVYLAFRLRDPAKGFALSSAVPHPAWAENPALYKYLPWDWVVSEPLPKISCTSSSPSDVPLIQGQRNLYEIITLYVPPGIPGIPVDDTHIATSTMLLRPTSSDAPIIVPNYLSTDLDRDTILHATRRTLHALLGTRSMQYIVEGKSPAPPPQLEGKEDKTTTFEPLTTQSSNEVIERRIRQTGSQHAHSGGTAAMGTVVDTEGRVLGVDGLRVADASIVPIALGGHPQATLYVVAKRIADLVLREWEEGKGE